MGPLVHFKLFSRLFFLENILPYFPRITLNIGNAAVRPVLEDKIPRSKIGRNSLFFSKRIGLLATWLSKVIADLFEGLIENFRKNIFLGFKFALNHSCKNHFSSSKPPCYFITPKIIIFVIIIILFLHIFALVVFNRE